MWAAVSVFQLQRSQVLAEESEMLYVEPDLVIQDETGLELQTLRGQTS